ncbi:MAG: ribokinase [Rhodanobacteraceae bacterium]
MPGKVLVIGSYNQDHAWRVARFPVAGETVRGTGFSSGAGGKGFNQAVACVRQGVETTFVGARGDDALGTLAADTARAAGLDCHWQVVTDQPTGSAAIVVDDNSQNQIVVTLGANLHLAPAHIHARTADFAACDVVLLQLETTVDAVQAALHAAASGNSLRILNPAPFDAGINLEMIAQCDLLTPNETEFALLCQHLTGTTIDAEAIAGMGDKELHLLCRRLPVACVIITLGSQGCFVSHDAGSSRLIDAQEHYRVPAEAVNAIDTTGAGDAFNGALAAALTRWPDAAAKKSVIHASRAAALSTEHDGAADSMVTFDAVTKRFGAPI